MKFCGGSRGEPLEHRFWQPRTVECAPEKRHHHSRGPPLTVQERGSNAGLRTKFVKQRVRRKSLENTPGAGPRFTRSHQGGDTASQGVIGATFRFAISRRSERPDSFRLATHELTEVDAVRA